MIHYFYLQEEFSLTSGDNTVNNITSLIPFVTHNHSIGGEAYLSHYTLQQSEILFLHNPACYGILGIWGMMGHSLLRDL